MASLRSLGVHKPSALPYLINEGILANDATDDDYTWETYRADHVDESVEDELVTTKYHVVWSRGGVVQRCFNFEIEQERVIQAILTWFPTSEPVSNDGQAENATGHKDIDASNTFLTQGTQPTVDPNATVKDTPRMVEGRARALVVFLKSQAHVFFLTGAHHMVNLPFEVERAFPAARGAIIQRKIQPLEVTPATPQLPSAPPNSFLTASQSFLSQTFAQSFSQAYLRNGSPLGPSRHAKPPRPGSTNASFLEGLLKDTMEPLNDDLPRVFSFTDPLSELGLVVSAVSGNERASLLTVNGSGHRRLEPIDKAEEVLYVSPQNEIEFDRSGNDQPLFMVITENRDRDVITVWSVAYLEPKSISNSRKNASLSNHKSRRRSSYGPTVPGTGATTPAVRGADRLRESFGGAVRSKGHPPSFNAPQAKDKLSDQAVEDALASQLNPETDLSRQPKDSRRVSSLLSRAELSTSFDKHAFQDLATQRTSLGGSFNASQRSRYSLGNDRTSFGGGHSRHRASTPGSVSRLSLGGASADDTFEDLMDEDTFDTLEDFDELDELFSPYDADFDQGSMNGLRKELVITPIVEIPVRQYMKPNRASASSPTSVPRVFVSAAPFNSATLHERKLHIYLVHASLMNPLECEFTVTRKRLSVTSTYSTKNGTGSGFRYACVPKLVRTEEMTNATDLIKLVDGSVERVLCLSAPQAGESHLSLAAGWGSHLPTKLQVESLNLFNPYAVLQDTQMRVTAGLKRTITARQPLQKLLFSGPKGLITVVDAEHQRHRMQISLAPSNAIVEEVFRLLRAILQNHVGDFLLQIWWNVRKTFAQRFEQQADADWTALITTLFTLAVPFIEDKSKMVTKQNSQSQRRSTGRTTNHNTSGGNNTQPSAWQIMCDRERSEPDASTLAPSAWSWALTPHSSPISMSPPTRRSSARQETTTGHQNRVKKQLLVECADIARQFVQSPIGLAANDQWRRLSSSEKQDLRITSLLEITVALHLLREERKLNALSDSFAANDVGNLSPVLSQLGHWLRWESWGFVRGGYYDMDGGSIEEWSYEDSHLNASVASQPWEPPSIFRWINTVLTTQSYVPFSTLGVLIRKSKASPHSSVNIADVISILTPRTIALDKFFQDIHLLSSPRKAVELAARCGIDPKMIDTFPEAIKAPLMEAITKCQANPPTTWPSSLLRLVQREDLDLSLMPNSDAAHDVQQHHAHITVGPQARELSTAATRDFHTICSNVDKLEHMQSTPEVYRHSITRLIFKDDRRFMEAYILLEPLRQAVAEYRPEPGMTDDSAILEAQKLLVQWVMIRTFSLPIGSSMVKFSSKRPLLTEKFHLYGFTTSCLMKPMGNTVTAERSAYSEEKFFWAFFNAGVAAGLSISRDAQGIDTSWIMYNKPADLSNRHAGLLLGLGLNGHLKNIAKWLSYKYLTPKHTMTSVGLLLGLSASFMGTMDTTITRLLSIHITRMLPPGAAELNISPYVQTTGLMGIGMLYYSTQHRRMSEIMLSELEYVEEPDPSEPPDTLRDEAYRLAAGFALGFINLGKGKDLQGLHDMRIVERLLAVAVAPKPVHLVHILDQATPGAVIATALIFMKTHNESVARKIDIPDTLPQFDHVRPDVFLLRTLAKHLIMWDNIRPENDWLIENLPRAYQADYTMQNIDRLNSGYMPFFNILTGLLWSVSLKYAGTGDTRARDFLIRYLDHFIRICKLPALRYDAKLARNTVRNCQDLLALAAATVMAGTGDLDVLRRLRGLHGRVGEDTPYGSHLAAHMAFGALFMAGGTQTFSTSDKAIAALICAFYPLFPTDVQDSKAHLQAFRHFWVLAVESRCLVIRDVDTGRAIHMPITVHLAAGVTKDMTAPCLLPELDQVNKIETKDMGYWPSTLDFANNPLHLQSFKRHQTLHVRRRSPRDMHTSTFSATHIALNDAQSSRTARQIWDWLFTSHTIPSLSEFEKSDIGLILPTDAYSSTFLDTRDTVVDQRLVLRKEAGSWDVDSLRDLKGVLEWAERVGCEGDGRLSWLGNEVVERLRAVVLERGRGIEG